MIYIDQPLGIGGSFASNGYNVTTTEESGAMLVNFFYNFYSTYWNMTNNPLYFIGRYGNDFLINI